jgi:hypothetical protein
MYLNDAPFAEYVATMQMWRGTTKSRLWWPTFHLVSADYVSNPAEEAAAADVIGLTARGESPPPRPV